MEALRVGTARQSCNKEQMPGASYKSGQRLASGLILFKDSLQIVDVIHYGWRWP